MSFFNFAETAALHRGRIRLLRPIVWNGECLPMGTALRLPQTIMATLTPGTDYEAAIVDHPPRHPV